MAAEKRTKCQGRLACLSQRAWWFCSCIGPYRRLASSYALQQICGFLERLGILCRAGLIMLHQELAIVFPLCFFIRVPFVHRGEVLEWLGKDFLVRRCSTQLSEG